MQVFHDGLSSADPGFSAYLLDRVSALFPEGKACEFSGHDSCHELEFLCLEVYVLYVQISPTDALVSVCIPIEFVILHGKAHVDDFDLLDVEYLLFAPLRSFRLLQTEDS